MIEAILRKGDAWLGTWMDLALSPRTQSQRDISPLLFAFGNVLLSLAICAGTGLLYFAVNYRDTLRDQLRAHIGDASSLIAIVVPISLGLYLLSILIGSAGSFVVYRMLGSGAAHREHLHVNFHLTFLEPLAAAGIALFVLGYRGQVLESNLTLFLLVFAFVSTRLWYSWIAFHQLRALHRLPPKRNLAGFLIGEFPCLLVVAGTSFIATYLVLSLGVLTYD